MSAIDRFDGFETTYWHDEEKSTYDCTNLTGAEEATWDLSDLYKGMDDPALDRRPRCGGRRGRRARRGLPRPDRRPVHCRDGRVARALRDAARARRQGRLVRVAELDAEHRGPAARRAAAEGHRARLAARPEARLARPRDRTCARRRRRPVVRRARAGALPPLARSRPPVSPAPAERARGEDPGREVGDRAQRLGALLRRDAVGRRATSWTARR